MPEPAPASFRRRVLAHSTARPVSHQPSRARHATSASASSTALVGGVTSQWDRDQVGHPMKRTVIFRGEKTLDGHYLPLTGSPF